MSARTVEESRQYQKLTLDIADEEWERHKKWLIESLQDNIIVTDRVVEELLDSARVASKVNLMRQRAMVAIQYINSLGEK